MIGSNELIPKQRGIWHQGALDSEGRDTVKSNRLEATDTQM